MQKVKCIAVRVGHNLSDIVGDPALGADIAVEAVANARYMSPARIVRNSYEELVEAVRAEVESNGGSWVILSPECLIYPTPGERNPFKIKRIV